MELYRETQQGAKAGACNTNERSHGGLRSGWSYSNLGSAMGLRADAARGPLIGELEDADLHQLGDGQVFEAAVFHVVNEIGSDLEDADLDEFVEAGLVAETANLCN